MVDYETFCKIRDHLGRQQLTVAQTARALGMDARTVAKWAEVEQFHQRTGVARVSKLDAYKGQIVRWLDAHPYSAQQIFQRVREAGYQGGITIVKDYVHRIRPRRQEAFLKLDFAAGECAQADWGVWHHRRGLHAPTLELLSDGAVLLPAHVPGVHGLAEDGVLSGLP